MIQRWNSITCNWSWVIKKISWLIKKMLKLYYIYMWYRPTVAFCISYSVLSLHALLSSVFALPDFKHILFLLFYLLSAGITEEILFYERGRHSPLILYANLITILFIKMDIMCKQTGAQAQLQLRLGFTLTRTELPSCEATYVRKVNISR